MALLMRYFDPAAGAEREGCEGAFPAKVPGRIF
jgi:hypothetical protein